MSQLQTHVQQPVSSLSKQHALMLVPKIAARGMYRLEFMQALVADLQGRDVLL